MADILLIPASVTEELLPVPVAEVNELGGAPTTIPLAHDRLMWIEDTGYIRNIRAMAIAVVTGLPKHQTSMTGRVYITGGTPQRPEPLTETQGCATVAELRQADALLRDLLSHLTV